MKILFSADWHLGYELSGANRQPRLADQLRQLRLIAKYLDDYSVDVLAIAGDVFEAQEKGAALKAISEMMDVLAVPLSRGLRIVAIAGNHDRDFFMETANVWLGVHTNADDKQIVFRTEPDLVTLAVGDERVNFVLMPFPTASRYALELSDSGGVASRNELLGKLYIEVLESFRTRAEAQRLPVVLLTHLTIEGTEVNAHRLSRREDFVLGRNAFPSFEMTIVGHIHKAAQLGSGYFYYVGALDRMDVGERDYEPRVLLADIGPAGVREITSLALDPTPFAAITASDEASLIAARGMIARPDETLVKLTLQVPQGTYLAPLLDRAHQLFPRLYGNVDCDWTDIAPLVPTVAGLNPANVEETVRRYLEEQQMPADERDALLELVTELRAMPAGVDA